jgi:hypothetical protein
VADFLIPSLRGGLNEDPPTSLADDQCTVAQNVEFWLSMLGERRLGGAAIDLTGSPLAACERIVWLHRHLPTADNQDAQLWGLGITGSTGVLSYKDTAWHVVAMPDPILVDGATEWMVCGQSFNSKLFIAYRSNVDRLHCWEPGLTALRRVGLAVPPGVAALTWVDTGTAGSFTGTRHYRARYAVVASGATVRRSEATPAQAAVPSGFATGLTVSLSTSLGEGETHWELEASINGVDFYRIGQAPLGTSITDTTNYASGYAQAGFPLSDQSGDAEPWPSVQLLSVDSNRLVGANLWHRTATDQSTVIWSASLNDPTGVADEERIPLATSNALGLDANEGGPLTCLSSNVNGYLYVTKASAIYQLTRTGMRTHAYEAICLTKQRGAMHSSMVEAFDQTGQPSLFCCDPHIGPCHIGARGVEPCGLDICRTWATVNLNYTSGIVRALYYPLKKQIHWRLQTTTGFKRLVLHTQEMRQVQNGLRGGWSVWDGASALAGAWCLFSDNINDNGPRNNNLRPFLGFIGNGLIWQMEQGDTDNSAAYVARLRTKPFVHGSLLNQFEVHSAMLLAGAIPGGILDVTVRGDFGLTQTSAVHVTLDPVAGEQRVIKNLDGLGLAELRAVQVTFEDAPAHLQTTALGVTRWALEQFAMREVGGARA